MRKLFVIIPLMALCCLLLVGCKKDKKIAVANPPAKIAEVKFDLKVYVENSGSMDGYMCDGSELKDAIYDYVSSLDSEADTTELNYINTIIIPYQNDIDNFIKNLNPAAFKSAGGDRSHSDIADMMESILHQQNDNTVSIFVSDCILDVPYGAAADFMVNKQTKLKNIFHKYLRQHPDLSVCVYQLESKFDGVYFYNNGKQTINNKRPYYMWMIGSKNIIANVQAKIPNTEIKHGLKNYSAFCRVTEVPCTFIQSGTDKNNAALKTAKNGYYNLQLKANLSSTLQEDTYLTDLSNYDVFTPNIAIDKIVAIKVKNSPYTHLFDLSVDKNIASISGFLKLKTQLPDWIETSNDDEGTDVLSNKDKTFGIKYIIGGVAEAFKNEDAYAVITLTIN